MHYPLAMRPLALMDQRACKELEEPATVQQDKKTNREGEDRGLADGDGGKRKQRRVGVGTCRRGLRGSWLSECRQLDPPERRPLKGSAIGST